MVFDIRSPVNEFHYNQYHLLLPPFSNKKQSKYMVICTTRLREIGSICPATNNANKGRPGYVNVSKLDEAVLELL